METNVIQLRGLGFGLWISKRIHFQLSHQFQLVNFCIWCVFNRFVTKSNFLASPHEKEMRYFSYPSMFAIFVTRNIHSPLRWNCLAMRFYTFLGHFRRQNGGFKSFAFIIRGYNVTQRKLVIYYYNNDKINRRWTTPFRLIADNKWLIFNLKIIQLRVMWSMSTWSSHHQ